MNGSLALIGIGTGLAVVALAGAPARADGAAGATDVGQHAAPSAPRTAAVLAATGEAHPWAARIRQARRYADRRRGRVGIAVIDERGRVRGGRRLHEGFHSASVVKVVMMICYLNHPTVRNRPLGRYDRSLLGPMIRRSANGPANRIYTGMGPLCLQSAARRAGIRGFSTQPVWGRSRITPVGADRMMRRVHRIVPARHRRYAMRLLATVVPSQRWGLPPSRPDGWNIRFKGGWAGNPGGGRIVNQAAVFQRGERRFAIVVLTNGSPTHDYGTTTIRGVGSRLLRAWA